MSVKTAAMTIQIVNNSSPEMILNRVGEFAGIIVPRNLYGLNLWRAIDYSENETLYTTREEAVNWLLFGTT